MTRCDVVGVYEKGKHEAWSGKKNTKEYDIWKSMMNRCYNEKSQIKRPTYIGCTVCDEWHSFQSFAQWYKDNSKGKTGRLELDKDLKVVGNKTYSPDTCLLIEKTVNIFIRGPEGGSGKYPIGVSIAKATGKFRSRCNNPITGKTEQVGTFNSEADAHIAWRKRKREIAIQLASDQADEEVKRYLIAWGDSLIDDL